MSHSFVVKLLLAAAVPMSIMLGSGLILHNHVLKGQEASEEARRGQAIIAAAHHLNLKFQDAQAGVNALILTQQNAYLEPYNQALLDFRFIHSELSDLLREDAEQQQLLAEAERLFQVWINSSAAPLIARQREGMTQIDQQLYQWSERLISSFRSVIEELVAAESNTLIGTREQHRKVAHDARWTALVGFGSAGVLALIFWLLLANRTSLAITGMTRAAEKFVEGDLSYRAPVVGKDELATMARTFNRMAVRLQSLIRSEQEAHRTLLERVNRMVAGRTRELLAMNDMVELLQSSQSFDEAVTICRTLLPGLFPDAVSGALLARAKSDVPLLTAVQWGEQSRHAENFYQDEDCWAIRRGKSHHSIVDSDSKGLYCNHIEPSPGHHLCMPLAAQGEVFGVLHIAVADEADAHSEERIQFAASVSDQLAISLANLRLRDSLREQSMRDPLTNLYNRRYLEDSIQRELARADREKKPLSIIMLDIDFFKRINDEYGHAAGDQVLVVIARILSENVRGEDLVCRYGGEEFTVIMPGADQVIACERAEMMRCAIQGEWLNVGAEKPLSITASFGVASSPLHANDADQLFSRADEALFMAKETGRNRVHVARPDAE